jgi:hypothetical protein
MICIQVTGKALNRQLKFSVAFCDRRKKMKNWRIVGKFILLWLLVLVAMVVSSVLTGTRETANLTPGQQKAAGLALVVVSFCYAFVFVLITTNSSWRGIKLSVALFFAFFGINGFLTQIESLVFLQYLTTNLPPEMLPKILLYSAVTALLCSFLAPLVYGRLLGRSDENKSASWLTMPASEWAWKLALTGIVYVVVYFAFGALVAVPLAGDAFKQYYGDIQLPWWMPFFQFGRGIIWTLTALPVLFMWKEGRMQAAFIVGTMFAIFAGIALLMPNPFMIDGMRYAHLVEMLSSNFVNGLVLVVILGLKRKAPQELGILG